MWYDNFSYLQAGTAAILFRCGSHDAQTLEIEGLNASCDAWPLFNHCTKCIGGQFHTFFIDPTIVQARALTIILSPFTTLLIFSKEQRRNGFESLFQFSGFLQLSKKNYFKLSKPNQVANGNFLNREQTLHAKLAQSFIYGSKHRLWNTSSGPIALSLLKCTFFQTEASTSGQFSQGSKDIWIWKPWKFHKNAKNYENLQNLGWVKPFNVNL